MLESGLPDIPLAEKCYRRFWWRKGDVYRLLMSLQNVIDGSTWPKEDKRRVNELVGLIHHVTGVPHLPNAAAWSFAAFVCIGKNQYQDYSPTVLHPMSRRTCTASGGATGVVKVCQAAMLRLT
jgi:hypothetical protein